MGIEGDSDQSEGLRGLFMVQVVDVVDVCKLINVGFHTRQVNVVHWLTFTLSFQSCVVLLSVASISVSWSDEQD